VVNFYPVDSKGMKVALTAAFVLMSLTFLLVSTVFWQDVIEYLQGISALRPPDLWDLKAVLKIVRVVFFMVGLF